MFAVQAGSGTNITLKSTKLGRKQPGSVLLSSFDSAIYTKPNHDNGTIFVAVCGILMIWCIFCPPRYHPMNFAVHYSSQISIIRKCHQEKDKFALVDMHCNTSGLSHMLTIPPNLW